MRANYALSPITTIKAKNREIAVFPSEGKNINWKVVESFGEEWNKFHTFSEEEIQKIGKEYFDIVDGTMLNERSYVIDIGCGSGRWTKYWLRRVGFIEAIDPSTTAIIAADHLLAQASNVRLTVASVENIPFADEAFDFAMSIGVLHHVPDPQQAIVNCVNKIRRGGYFYIYLYYNLENRGVLFKTIFKMVNAIRLVTSAMPAGLKKLLCELIAIFVYVPLVFVGKLLNVVGLTSLAEQIPLSAYSNKSISIMRNDALDRFGTAIEHRFSKAQLTTMLQNAGLEDIVISKNIPYYHAIGRKMDTGSFTPSQTTTRREDK